MSAGGGGGGGFDIGSFLGPIASFGSSLSDFASNAFGGGGGAVPDMTAMDAGWAGSPLDQAYLGLNPPGSQPDQQQPNANDPQLQQVAQELAPQQQGGAPTGGQTTIPEQGPSWITPQQPSSFNERFQAAPNQQPAPPTSFDQRFAAAPGQQPPAPAPAPAATNLPPDITPAMATTSAPAATPAATPAPTGGFTPVPPGATGAVTAQEEAGGPPSMATTPPPPDMTSTPGPAPAQPGVPGEGGGQQPGQQPGRGGVLGNILNNPQAIDRLIQAYIMGGPGALMQTLRQMVGQMAPNYGQPGGYGPGPFPRGGVGNMGIPPFFGGFGRHGRGGRFGGFPGGRGNRNWTTRWGSLPRGGGGFQGGFPFAGNQQQQQPGTDASEADLPILPNEGGPRAGQMPTPEEIAAAKSPQSGAAPGEKSADRVPQEGAPKSDTGKGDKGAPTPSTPAPPAPPVPSEPSIPAGPTGAPIPLAPPGSPGHPADTPILAYAPEGRRPRGMSETQRRTLAARTGSPPDYFQRHGGRVGANLTRINTPYGPVTANRQVAQDFVSLTSDMQAAGIPGIRSFGSYSPRRKAYGRGWSSHAYGAAFDINDQAGPMNAATQSWINTHPEQWQNILRRNNFVQYMPTKDPNHLEWTGPGASAAAGQGGISSAMEQFPGRQEGGPVQAGQPYTVGEAGPETFVPSQQGEIVPDIAPGAQDVYGTPAPHPPPAWEQMMRHEPQQDYDLEKRLGLPAGTLAPTRSKAGPGYRLPPIKPWEDWLAPGNQIPDPQGRHRDVRQT
jgi:hypothetical protein